MILRIIQIGITKVKYCYIFFALTCLFFSCKEEKKEKIIPSEKTIPTPSFNADSAYFFIKTQTDFGPRVPNTKEHEKCAQYLIEKLRQSADTVIVQSAQVKAYDGTTLNIKNIIGSFKPQTTNRILLFAHWDTRHIADQEDDPELRKKPILGANDGASGVGVLLEIARQIRSQPPIIGIDIIFFDAEDYGQPEEKGKPQKGDTWCLGSQYWAKNPHKKHYYAKYGILLDMVGAKNATFTMEGTSMHFASNIVKKVWNIALQLGYSDYFVEQQTHAITDDHYYVNKIANIPSINIIQYDETTQTKFGSYWHTHNDNMSIIDKNTLKAVGQVVLEVIYREK